MWKSILSQNVNKLLCVVAQPVRNLISKQLCRLKTTALVENRVRSVHKKNGSDPVPDFSSTISAGPGPIYQGTHTYLSVLTNVVVINHSESLII